MKVIVGLGNPGRRYAGTRHNVGYAVVDELASRWGCALKRSFRLPARIGRAACGGHEVLLVKPRTFMNESGNAVAAVLRAWRRTPDDLVVLLDDADLPLGRLRVKARGGSGGHRGLGSVIDAVGSEQFARIRMGIGRRAAAGGLTEHVLSPFAAEDRAAAGGMVRRCADAVQGLLADGVASAMNAFNADPAPERGDDARKGGV